jgi:hypothetical protein
MSLRQFQLGSKTRTLVFKGLALSLGAVMVAGGAAMAQRCDRQSRCRPVAT